MRNQHYFTLDEANGLLQWLEAKFTQLDPYRAEVTGHKHRSAEILRQHRGNGSTHLESELLRVQQLMEELQKGIQDIVQEMTSRGVVVQDLDQGLVDFPALRDSHEVYLCWLRGEQEVQYWHEVNAGFAGRQLL